MSISVMTDSMAHTLHPLKHAFQVQNGSQSQLTLGSVMKKRQRCVDTVEITHISQISMQARK